MVVIKVQRLLLKKKTQLQLDLLLLVLNYYYCVLPSINYHHHQFSSVQSLSHVRLLATPWTAARQASLSITNPWSLLKLMSIESVMLSNHLILCSPFSCCLQSFPIFLTITIYFHIHWRNPHMWLWGHKWLFKKSYLHFKRLLKFSNKLLFFFLSDGQTFYLGGEITWYVILGLPALVGNKHLVFLSHLVRGILL